MKYLSVILMFATYGCALNTQVKPVKPPAELGCGPTGYMFPQKNGTGIDINICFNDDHTVSWKPGQTVPVKPVTQPTK